MNNNSTHGKAVFTAKYNELLNTLENAKNNIGNIRGTNSDFLKYQEELQKAISNQIENTRQEMKTSIEEIPWDRLVIAFFGETNAGKSSIIETFRILFEQNHKKESDGLIVGDGRHDYTKEYHEYELTIHNIPFTLIDVPGIEGNEIEFEEGIKNALKKAHCVFYVQGHNKKPDIATAEKIKNYLSNGVKVYSIYNIRGAVSDYDEEEERKTLLTPKVLEAETLIKQTFHQILGDIYNGNISLQALLAMCANASFAASRTDLIKTQEKLHRYFGKSDEILKFSQFQTIINLVEKLAKNFTQEIEDSNMLKLTVLSKRASAAILHVSNERKDNIKKYKELLLTFKRESNEMYKNSVISIKKKFNYEIEHEFSVFQNEIYNIIDNDESKDEKISSIQKAQRRASDNINNKLKKILINENQELYENLSQKKKTLDGMNIHIPETSNISCEFDKNNYTAAIDNMDISWANVMSFLADLVGGALAGSFWGPWGAAIGATITGTSHLIRKGIFGDGGKSKAKEDADKEINKTKGDVKNQVSNAIKSISLKFNSCSQILKTSIETEIYNLKEIDNCISTFNLHLQQYINTL